VEDARSLERAAVSYLRRFAASSARLRKVLRRRIFRAERRGEALDRGALETEIDAIVLRMQARGLVDDEAYAKAVASSLRRRGTSRRAMRAKLRGKDLPADVVDAVLEADEVPELDAAWRYARRRKFGPYRVKERADRRQKDLAAMGRAGFGYGVSREVVDADQPR
jgi:regulatory protein